MKRFPVTIGKLTLDFGPKDLKITKGKENTYKMTPEDYLDMLDQIAACLESIQGEHPEVEKRVLPVKRQITAKSVGRNNAAAAFHVEVENKPIASDIPELQKSNRILKDTKELPQTMQSEVDKLINGIT